MGVKDGKYPQAKKALGIPPDEPIFVIRAQDNLARLIIARYKNAAIIAGCDQAFLEDLDVVDHDFEVWQADNKTKKPD